MQYPRIFWFTFGILVATLPFSLLASQAARAAESAPQAIAASACVPGTQAGTHCCSPQVPIRWLCPQGEVQVLGACALAAKADAGQLYRCARQPVSARAKSASAKTVAEEI